MCVLAFLLSFKNGAMFWERSAIEAWDEKTHSEPLSNRSFLGEGGKGREREKEKRCRKKEGKV